MMELIPKSPQQALERLYRREKLAPEIFDDFVTALDNYFYYTARAKEQQETEENFKKYFAELWAFFYPNYPQNTKSYKGNHEADWVIATPDDRQQAVLLFEIKKPDNATEMISFEKPNRKALHELVAYYLWERIVLENNELKRLIITNIDEVFIFDAADFYQLFYKNSTLHKQFELWQTGKLDASATDEIYKIIKKEIQKSEADLPVVHFHWETCRTAREQLKSTHPKEQEDARRLLVDVWKVLSPKFLLKQTNPNDNNELNKDFYFELLHILGLEERPEGGKKIIVRCENPHRGSLLENALTKLRTEDALHSLKHPAQYGDSTDEKYFNVALGLVITWLNRILFLKLLEAQLVSYNAEDADKEAYRFLHPAKIKEFDTLNTLFFEVLAIEVKQRDAFINQQYNRIPYLNSSLFEVTDLERQTLRISNLKDNLTLPIYPRTVLRSPDGRKSLFDANPLQEMPALLYLLSFLDAYDFGAEESDSVLQKETKPLISASVLGLIFEKINGYKEGSFFTPSFITMYMSRETLRRRVIDQFNEGFGLNAVTFEDVRNFCSRLYKTEDLAKANKIINSLTICDPAVGSGHFLVSVLNELLAIKSELGVLCDANGKPLDNLLALKVENDELIIYDRNGLPFHYKVSFANGFRRLIPEVQLIQETIFNEKKYLIEHCLFGVDINPNSVKICRLRLWIELLKNAYYRQGNNTQLETLPNIDINIKTGNSLIARYPLNADLNDVFRRSEYSVEEYKRAVKAYKTEEDKAQKRRIATYIADIKAEFSTTMDKREIAKIAEARGKLERLKNQLQNNTAFGFLPTATEKSELAKLEQRLLKLEAERDQILASTLYRNAFEWRFEFPEVLDEQGNFIGFDVVLGNPPYMRVQEIQKTAKEYYQQQYASAKASFELANLFFELAVQIVNSSGRNAFIMPHKFLNSKNGESLRNYLMDGKFIDKLSHFGVNMVFDEADTYTAVLQFSNHPNEGFYFQRFPFKSDFIALLNNDAGYNFISYKTLQNASQFYGSNQWILLDKNPEYALFEKIYQQKSSIQDKFEGIIQGIATSKDGLFIGDLIEEKENSFVLSFKEAGIYEVEKTFFKPFLKGKDVHRYAFLSYDKFVFFPYRIETESVTIVELKDLEINFPLTFLYLKNNEMAFKNRERGKADKLKHWYAYIYPKNLAKFETLKLSSMEICAKHPNVALNTDFIYHPTTVYSWIKKEDVWESYEYFLAIANSRLIWWFLLNTGDALQGDTRRLKTNYLNPFPLPLDPPKPIHDRIVALVEEVLALKKADTAADTSALENEIDGLVCDLYELTAEERAAIWG